MSKVVTVRTSSPSTEYTSAAYRMKYRQEYGVDRSRSLCSSGGQGGTGRANSFFSCLIGPPHRNADRSTIPSCRTGSAAGCSRSCTGASPVNISICTRIFASGI